MSSTRSAGRPWSRPTGSRPRVTRSSSSTPATRPLFGFEAPFQIVRDMIEAVPHAHGYSDSRGIMSARRAVVYRYEQDPTFPPFGPDDVYLGNGVSELITMVMQALLDEGDEVLIPAPDYPLWTAMTSLGGGTPVHYLADELERLAARPRGHPRQGDPAHQGDRRHQPEQPDGRGLLARGARGDRRDRPGELAARPVRRDLRPHPVRRRPAHPDGLRRSRSAVPHVQRPLQDLPRRGLSIGMARDHGSEGSRRGVHRGHHPARLDPAVPERPRAARRAGRAVGRPVDRRADRAVGPTARAAGCRVGGPRGDPRGLAASSRRERCTRSRGSTRRCYEIRDDAQVRLRLPRLRARAPRAGHGLQLADARITSAS